MHDLRLIRTNPHEFDLGLKRRGKEPAAEEILELDKKHRTLLTELQSLQMSRNQIAKDFAVAKREGSNTDALTQQSEQLKQQVSVLEHDSVQLEKQLHEILSSLPNLPGTETPDGLDESSNVEVRRHGAPPTFSFAPKQHFELGEQLGLMDFEKATKLSGSRFVVLSGALCRLERALASFMLDIHTNEFGYEETYIPLLVNDDAMFGVGQLPKFREDMFQTTTGHWLISTAEVGLTNLVAQEILSEEQLPLRYTSYTPCFRSEAGSAGRDTRGMIRQHQFTKVELVSITTPEQAKAEHERMTSAAETVLQKLGLAYRTMVLCAGDMGFSAEKTYDLEVWLPGQNMYREISSCSNCGSFQARRMNARYRPSVAQGKSQAQFVGTLNGSGVAVGRALVAIMENYQQEDGSIRIPEALIPYMGGIDIIRKTKP
jgi:seryl-tRNA synthetase